MVQGYRPPGIDTLYSAPGIDAELVQYDQYYTAEVMLQLPLLSWVIKGTGASCLVPLLAPWFQGKEAALLSEALVVGTEASS